MNRTRIEWTDFTWNPVTGCWGPGGTAERPNRCPYCYAHRMAGRFHRSFEPEFHPERLDQPHFVKKPARIFVCSTADLFGDWMDKDEIQHVINAGPIWEPRHTYIFLTKNPARLAEFNPWPENAWVGATATDDIEYRLAIQHLTRVEAQVRFISAEPFLKPIYPMGGDQFIIQWLIIGGLTGGGAPQPSARMIKSIIGHAQDIGLKIFTKDNLKWPEKIQEFPT